MNVSNTLNRLVVLTAILACFAAGIGLFYQDEGKAFSFVTLDGATVQIYGQGLYRFDTPLVAVGYRVADAVTLILGIPLLVVALVLGRRGSPKGALMLTGVLAYFWYNYGSLALGAAYNNLFLVYLAVFSGSLFALILALMAIDPQSLAGQFFTPSATPCRRHLFDRDRHRALRFVDRIEHSSCVACKASAA
jgi:hypothetical protein